MTIDRSSILNRIKKIFQGLTQTEVARICGVTQQAVNRYLKKNILPNYDAMLRIAKYGRVSIEWLLTGKGAKEIPVVAVREMEAIYPAPSINLVTYADYKNRLQKQISEKDCISIPIISESAAARYPLTLEDWDIESFAWVQKAWVNLQHSYVCLRVQCNCMDPIIRKGFVVGIDITENDPLKLESKIVATRYNGCVTLRCLKLTEKEYVLLPYNATVIKPIVIPISASNHFIGKVTWWCGRQE